MALPQGRDGDRGASCPAQLWTAACVKDSEVTQVRGSVLASAGGPGIKLRVNGRTLTFQFEPLVCPEFFQYSGPGPLEMYLPFDAIENYKD